MDFVVWKNSVIVASCSRDKCVKFWRMRNLQLDFLFSVNNYTQFVNAICFTNVKGKLLLYSGDSSGKITIIDFEDQTIVRVIERAHNDNICSLRSGLNNCVLSCSWDGSAKLWQFDECLNIWNISSLPCWDFIQYSQDFFISACSDKIIRLHSTTHTEKAFTGHKGCCRSICIIGKNDDIVVSAGNDGYFFALKLGFCAFGILMALY